MTQRRWMMLWRVVLLAGMLAACTPETQRQLGELAIREAQTAAARSGPTVLAAGKTVVAKEGPTAVALAETAAAEGAKQVQTQTANMRLTVEARASRPPAGPPFTVDTDLTQTVGVTGAGLDAAIRAIRPDSPLIGQGQAFVEVGDSLGINAYYIAAHAAWESTWGTSALARDKNNLFGYGAYDRCPYECAWTFETKQQCLETVMTLIKANYLTEGGKYYHGATLRGMNVSYATDQNWKNGIASIMNSLAAKVP